MFKQVLLETTENFERLGRQARPGIEPGTSHLLVLERRTAQPLVGLRTDNLTSMPYPGFEPETFDGVASFPNHCTAWSATLIKDVFEMCRKRRNTIRSKIHKKT